MKKTLAITILALLALGMFVSCNADAVETLFGNNEPSQFTVTFNANGGSAVENQTVPAGEKAARPAENPAKEGYVFVNWYSDEALTVAFDFNAPITKNTTIYAKWTPGPFGFKALQANSKVALTTVGTPASIVFEYSTDASNWLNYSLGTDITLSAVNDKVFFRAKIASSTGSLNSDFENGYRFTTSQGKVDVFGNIMYLADKEGKPNISANAFAGLFADCANLVNAENLVLAAPSLANACYSSMFMNCSSLETTPDLPATTLADECYKQMFLGCTSLTAAPALQAETLATGCYSSMFSGCASLETAPELPAMNAVTHCYNRMFYECSNLKTAPALNATELGEWCYKNMFYGCASLTEAPALPATALADYCYESMFQNCTSLTAAPELPATTLGAAFCYSYMFSGCTKLNSVTVRLTAWNGNATENWLQNTAATGTFTCPAGLPDTRDASHIPTGWDIQTL